MVDGFCWVVCPVKSVSEVLEVSCVGDSLLVDDSPADACCTAVEDSPKELECSLQEAWFTEVSLGEDSADDVPEEDVISLADVANSKLEDDDVTLDNDEVTLEEEDALTLDDDELEEDDITALVGNCGIAGQIRH